MLCGIPQGSIVEPLLFLIYINDLPNASNLLNFLLFADDTTILHSHYDPNELMNTLNTEISKVLTWLKAKKLSLNLTKTHYILFRPRQKSINLRSQLILEETHIKQVEFTKFLGVYLDQHLTWKNHIDFIAKKKWQKQLE